MDISIWILNWRSNAQVKLNKLYLVYINETHVKCLAMQEKWEFIFWQSFGKNKNNFISY